MKVYIKQAIYIVLFSIIVGIIFNSIRPNGIPYINKQLKVNYQTDDYIIEVIDLETAKEYYHNDVQFVDARNEVYFNAGHIAGAISAVDFISMTDEIFERQGFNEPIVVYCDDEECGLSEELAYRLEAEGFSKIYVFSGGWNLWLQEKLPIEK